jgi:hypothetical protein
MAENKLRRLQHKTYLQVIRNSVGTKMFRNWYLKTPDEGEFDAMRDGEDSCAFYVSSVLKIFDKVSAIHGTVESTIKDLEKTGWQKVSELKAGDVLVWEAQKFSNRDQAHIGFYIGDNKAVSTSWTKKTVVEHDKNFDGQNRHIEQTYRMENWDGNA